MLVGDDKCIADGPRTPKADGLRNGNEVDEDWGIGRGIGRSTPRAVAVYSYPLSSMSTSTDTRASASTASGAAMAAGTQRGSRDSAASNPSSTQPNLNPPSTHGKRWDGADEESRSLWTGISVPRVPPSLVPRQRGTWGSGTGFDEACMPLATETPTVVV